MNSTRPVLIIPGVDGGPRDSHFLARELHYEASITFAVFLFQYDPSQAVHHFPSFTKTVDHLAQAITRISSNTSKGDVILVAQGSAIDLVRALFVSPKYQPGTVKIIISVGSAVGSPLVTDFRFVKQQLMLDKVWSMSAMPLLVNVSWHAFHLPGPEITLLEGPHIASQWITSQSAGVSSHQSCSFGACRHIPQTIARNITTLFDHQGRIMDKRLRIQRPGCPIDGQFFFKKGLWNITKAYSVRPNRRIKIDKVIFEIASDADAGIEAKDGSSIYAHRLEIFGSAELSRCLRIYSADGPLPTRYEKIPTQSRDYYFASMDIRDYALVKVDGRLCEEQNATMVVLNEGWKKDHFPWTALRTFKDGYLLLERSASWHYRFDINLSADDYLYNIQLSGLQNVEKLAIRVRNMFSGQEQWFYEKQNPLLVQMSRDVKRPTVGRVDQVDLWIIEKTRRRSPKVKSITVEVEFNFWATGLVWLHRYWPSLPALILAILVNDLCRRGSGRTDVWCPWMLLILSLLIVLRYPIFLRRYVVWGEFTDLLLLPVEPGFAGTIVVLGIVWPVAVCIKAIFDCLVTSLKSKTGRGKVELTILRFVLYPLAILLPTSLAIISITLISSIALVPVRSKLGSNWLGALLIVSLMEAQLGWPSVKRMLFFGWTLRGHDPWITLPLALVSDLIASERLTVEYIAHLDCFAFRVLRWSLIGVVLALGLRFHFILLFVLVLIAFILVVLAGHQHLDSKRDSKEPQQCV